METKKYVPRKQSNPEEECIICREQIKIYAIGECGHNQICWRCCLKQRLKLEVKECPFCKSRNYKVLLARSQHKTLGTTPDAVYDPESDLYFEDQHLKAEVLRGIGFYCTECTEEYRKKFANQRQLSEHYVRAHKLQLCDLCLEHKPVLMSEQKLYSYSHVQNHIRKHHPYCFFCLHLCFYDQDSLNKHYMSNHYFCDICKKLGKKRTEQSKRINLPDYEVFKDLQQLQLHQRKHHFICDKVQCVGLVYEDRIQLAQHYAQMHGEKMQVQLGFGESDEEEEQYQEEEKAQPQNADLTKENYREVFPTLGQSNRGQAHATPQIESDRWPILPQRPATNQQQRQQAANKQKQKKIIDKPKPVQDRQSRINEQQIRREERKQLEKIARQVDNTDYDLEYREQDDIGQISHIESTNQGGGGKSKKKQKRVVVAQVRERQEEKQHVNLKEKEYPSLLEENTQKITKHKFDSGGGGGIGWNKVISSSRTNPEIQDQTKIVPTQKVYKDLYPTLPQEKLKPKPQQKQPENGSEKPMQIIVTKKKKNKNKGKQVVDLNQFEKIDYNKNLNSYFKF